jgi:hypothetical protein
MKTSISGSLCQRLCPGELSAPAAAVRDDAGSLVVFDIGRPAVRRVWQVGGADAGGTGLRSRDGAAAVSVAGRHDSVAVEVDDPFTEAGVRGKDAVVAVAMDAGRRDQAAESGEKLEGREGEDGAAVAGGTGGQVEDLENAGIAI